MELRSSDKKQLTIIVEETESFNVESDRGERRLNSPRHILIDKIIKPVSLIAFLVTVILTILFLISFISDQPEPFNYQDAEFTFSEETTKLRDSLTPFNASAVSEGFNVFLDGHSHTKFSDGKLPVKKLIEFSIASGFNALIVTDHQTVAGGLEAEKLVEENEEFRNKITIIPGMEYTSCR